MNRLLVNWSCQSGNSVRNVYTIPKIGTQNHIWLINSNKKLYIYIYKYIIIYLYVYMNLPYISLFRLNSKHFNFLLPNRPLPLASGIKMEMLVLFTYPTLAGSSLQSGFLGYLVGSQPIEWSETIRKWSQKQNIFTTTGSRPHHSDKILAFIYYIVFYLQVK